MGKTKIIVCDDSEVVLEFARGALEEAGYAVVTTDNPLSLAHVIRRELPDLILIDVNMPSISGDAVTQIFGNTGVAKNVPILLHSDLTAAELEMRAKRAGATGFIQKTGDEAQLIEGVARFLAARARGASPNVP
jgi:CheY-like chemotaxis protein